MEGCECECTHVHVTIVYCREESKSRTILLSCEDTCIHVTYYSWVGYVHMEMFMYIPCENVHIMLSVIS